VAMGRADIDDIADHGADCRRRHRAPIAGKMATMSSLRDLPAEGR